MTENTISVDTDLVDEARALGLDVEAICEAAIREAIRAEKVARGPNEGERPEGLWTSNEWQVTSRAVSF